MVKDLRAQLRRSEEEVATLQVRFCFKFCMDERGTRGTKFWLSCWAVEGWLA